MDSPLQLIEGDVRHAVLTTYSLNLAFLERWVIPRLRECGATNIVVLADHAQLGEALADARPRRAGRDYHLVATRLGPGAFHPKVIYLRAEDHARACVSSANLTVDGQLRNVEAGVVLDGSEHPSALLELARFLNRVGETAPAHVREAIRAATQDLPPVERDDDNVTVVHNLERPILDQLPELGALTSYTAYADGGEAADALVARGATLTVSVDANHFEAPASFLDGAWTVDPLTFDGRRLHGKVLSDAAEPWVLVGSPNLSAPALRRRADAGNVEIAVLLRGTGIEVIGEPWSGDPATLAAHSAQRWTTDKAEPSAPLSFNSWIDRMVLHTSGLPHGATVEIATGSSWLPLGPLEDDHVAIPLGPSVYRVRAWYNGREYRSLAHDTSQLTSQRQRTARGQRTAHLLSHLPMDPKDLGELSSLVEQLGRIAQHAELPNSQTAGTDDQPPTPILEWLPADPLGMPTVPPLIRAAWHGDPDTLLALVRNALRLPDLHSATTADDFADGFEAEPDEDAATTVETPEAAAASIPVASRRVLNKYRKDFVAMMERAATWIRDAARADVAALTFQTVLLLQEQLASTTALVEGVEEVLVDDSQLVRSKWEVIQSYLRRADRDPMCVATALHHLAVCIDAKNSWDTLEWESIKALAIELAPQVFEPDDALSASLAAIDSDRSLTKVFDPFRSSWEPIVEEAEGYLLGDFRHGEHPCCFVSGDTRFDRVDESEAWHLIAIASTFSFTSGRQVAVIARNLVPRSPAATHIIVLDPQAKSLVDAFHRRSDDQWVIRSYSPATRETLDAVRDRGVHAVQHKRRLDTEVSARDRSMIEDVIELTNQLDEPTAVH